MAAIAGRVVTFGGHIKEDQAVGTVEAYDPVRNAWTVLKDLPEPRSCPAAVELNGQVYVVGGSAPLAWRNGLKSVIAVETAAFK